MAKPTLKWNVDRYGNLKTILKHMEEEEKALNKAIKEELHRRGKPQYAGDAFCVQLGERSSGDRIDKEKLIAKYGREALEADGILIPASTQEYLTVAPIQKILGKLGT